ncbi:MAG: ABC transporter ATP-binding protein [Candidatus Omnitrophica bacterium]|nr:ABC transporter ATP-binding protein [Candidatus Omnitrophota bacterium]
MSDLILETQDLHKVYEGHSAGRVEVLRGVNFQVSREGVYYILGHSGTGKSTLLHLLGGLDRPSQGDVIFDGRSFDSMNESELAAFRNQEVGFIFQFYYLLPELNLLENVMLPGMIAKDPNAKSRALDLLDHVGLSKRLKHRPSQLSGGEQQRAAIARALINEPQVVLCDEPTGNLDEENAKNVYDLIESLNREKGQTFCIVTHEESFVKGRPNVYRLSMGQLNKES